MGDFFSHLSHILLMIRFLHKQFHHFGSTEQAKTHQKVEHFMTSQEIHVDKDNSHLIEDFIGVIVNIEVIAKVAVFVKFDGSTLLDLVHSIGKI